MVVHGWQDYNVKQEEGTALFEALPVDPAGKKGVPFKKLWLTQQTHANGSGAGYQEHARRVLGQDAQEGPQGRIEKRPAVTSLGRTAAGPGRQGLDRQRLQPRRRRRAQLHLGRSVVPWRACRCRHARVRTGC